MKKISVVSGGSSGLGVEIAALLAKSGKNILILGRNEKKLELATENLRKTSGVSIIESMVCNIGNGNDIRNVGTFMGKNNYTVEYLFNNAGRGLFAAAKTSTARMVDEIFEANIKGMILLTSEILRITPEENDLTVINIMSTSALFGRAEESIYCAAKFGARGYTEALRTEFKGKNRNIIAVYPGGMRTDFWKMPGQNRDVTNYMDPKEVAAKIVSAVTGDARLTVSDITITRKQS